MTPTSFTELVQTFGLPLSIFMTIIVTGAKEVWVYGHTYRAERARADRFEQLALDLLQTTRKAVQLAEKQLDRAP